MKPELVQVLDAIDSFTMVLRRLHRNRYQSDLLFYVLIILPMWTASRVLCAKKKKRKMAA